MYTPILRWCTFTRRSMVFRPVVILLLSAWVSYNFIFFLFYSGEEKGRILRYRIKDFTLCTMGRKKMQPSYIAIHFKPSVKTLGLLMRISSACSAYSFLHFLFPTVTTTKSTTQRFPFSPRWRGPYLNLGPANAYRR